MSDFQTQAGVQGRAFEDVVETMLKVVGWTIDQTHAVIAGCEIDIVATSPEGVQWWIECKGSWRGKTPGSRRGDTAKKAVAVAWYLSLVPDRAPYMLVTSHLPTPGTISARLLDAAMEHGLFTEISTLAFLANVPDEDEL